MDVDVEYEWDEEAGPSASGTPFEAAICQECGWCGTGRVTLDAARAPQRAFYGENDAL
jgi:hypothetical protein